MKIKKYNFIGKCIMLFFIISIPIYSITLEEGKNVSIYDCNNQVIRSDKNTFAWDILSALKEALEKSKECLPEKYSNSIYEYQKIKKIIIFLDCTSPTKNCGQTLQSFRKGVCITLYKESIYMEGACGCIEATILHELLHWGAGMTESNEDEKIAYGCEEKCFPDCAKDRRGIEPEDCCEKLKTNK